MEGIVGYSGNYRQKLILPNSRRAGTISKRKQVALRKELYVTQILRHGIGLFLKYF